MSKRDKKEIVQMILHQNLEKKDKEEIIDMLADSPIAIDVDKEEEKNLTFSEKLADKISEIAGSWGFIIIFILLNLILSCLTALQAPIIMMSQNRASKKDSLRNQNDYQVDLKSELILEDLHNKIELILKNEQKLVGIIDKIIEETNKEKS